MASIAGVVRVRHFRKVPTCIQAQVRGEFLVLEGSSFRRRSCALVVTSRGVEVLTSRLSRRLYFAQGVGVRFAHRSCCSSAASGLPEGGRREEGQSCAPLRPQSARSGAQRRAVGRSSIVGPSQASTDVLRNGMCREACTVGRFRFCLNSGLRGSEKTLPL